MNDNSEGQAGYIECLTAIHSDQAKEDRGCTDNRYRRE
jgi:hypothetical protein